MACLQQLLLAYGAKKAFDVSGASYSSKSLSISSQGTNPWQPFLKTDGSKFYFIDDGNQRVYQYSLSTAFDLSTGSYDSKNANVGGQVSIGRGVFFKNDGLKMYVLDTTGATVYQYTLSVAWDASTATYASKSLDVSAHGSFLRGMTMSDDGTRVVIGSAGDNFLYMYTLGTAFDLSTGSYTGSFNASAQINSLFGMGFSSDGKNLLICDGGLKKIWQYTISTAYNITTASYSGHSLDVSSQAAAPNAVVVSSDDTKFYVTDDTTNAVYEYTM